MFSNLYLNEKCKGTLQIIFPPWFYLVFDLHLHSKYLYCLDGIELETGDSDMRICIDLVFLGIKVSERCNI